MAGRPFSIALLLIACAAAADSLAADDVLEADSKPFKVVDGCKFTEGPVFNRAGELLFSDGANDRIMRRSRGGELTVFKQPCGRVNGMTLDHQGRLIVCQSSGEGGGRRVSRLDAGGAETVLTERYEGKPYIGPNDVCLDGQGRIYFTDPYYGPPAEKSQPTSGVYCIDPDGRVTRVVSDLERPNGIVVTPDGRLVYISDRGTQKLHRYELTDDGALRPSGVVYDFSPDRGVDGMRLDVEGNIYAAAGEKETTGLFVVSPDGRLLLHQPLPEFATNVVFGGDDRRDLYITATTAVYKLRTTRAGAPVPVVERKGEGR
jgi:gluconolactonase